VEKAEIAHLCVVSAWNATSIPTRKRLDLNDFISFPGWKQLMPFGNAGGYQSMFSDSELAKKTVFFLAKNAIFHAGMYCKEICFML